MEPGLARTSAKSYSRHLLILVALALLLALPVLAPPVYGADQGVQVDNSLGNGLVEGTATQESADQAHLTLANDLNVWVAVDLDQSPTEATKTGNVSLAPQGLFANLGLIGPGSDAAWTGTFGPNSSQPMWAHVDFRTTNGAEAAVATVLTVMADAADGFTSPTTPSKLKLAVGLVKATSAGTKLLDYMGRTDPAKLNFYTITTLFTALVKDPNARANMEQALEAMGVSEPAKALANASKGLSLLDLGRTLFDLCRAALGSGSGQVTFYRAGNVATNSSSTTSTTLWYSGLFPVAEDGKFGYIDRSGKMIIEPRYDNAYRFIDGYAPVQVGDKWGFIDTNGKMVIQPQFEDSSIFTEGLAGVEIDGKSGFIDAMGNVVIQPAYDGYRYFLGGLAAVLLDDKWGFIDTNGKMVIQPQFDEVGYFGQDGLVGVKVSAKYGFIDNTGKIIIQPQYDATGGFGDGLADVKVGDKWGFIDKMGNMAIQPQYEQTMGFGDDLAAVKVGDKWGFIDKTGKMVIQPQFDWAYGFSTYSDDLAAVKVGDKWGFIDRTGKMVIQPQFDSTYAFIDGLARVEIESDYAYINTIGRVVWRGPTPAGSQGAGSTSTTAGMPAGYARYTDEADGFSILYPKSWITEADGQSNKFQDPSTESESWPTQIAVLRKNIGSGFSPEEFAKTMRPELQGQGPQSDIWSNPTSATAWYYDSTHGLKIQDWYTVSGDIGWIVRVVFAGKATTPAPPEWQVMAESLKPLR